MKKVFLFIITIFLVVFTCACDNEQSLVLFNKHPFTADTINSPSNTNVFATGERIYYLVTLPKPVETKSLLIQILKVGGDSDERLGYELVLGKRVKLRDEQTHYFTDYVVFNTKGAYLMKVYSRDNPTKILTTANFYVKN